MATKILLLEDDKLFNETLQDFLEEEGSVINCVLDPYSALDLMYENNYNLYLFGVNKKMIRPRSFFSHII